MKPRLKISVPSLSLIAAAAVALLVPAGASAAGPDSSWGHGGIRKLAFGEDAIGEFRDVAPLPGGGALAGGRIRGGDAKAGPLLARFTAAGELDPTFGDGGVIERVVPTAARGAVTAVQALPGGRVLLAGWTARAEAGVFVARLLADGSPDPSFGDGGVRELDVAGGREVTSGAGLTRRGGRIYLGVRARTPTGGESKVGAVVLRRNGDVYSRFGVNGRVLVPSGTLHDFAGTGIYDSCTGCQYSGLAVDGRGRVLISGTAGSLRSKIGVVRYDSYGRRDRRFGDRGRVVAGFTAGKRHVVSVEGGPLLAGPGGTFLVAGGASIYRRHGGRKDAGGFAVAAFRGGGRLDRGFSGDGLELVRFEGDGAWPLDMERAGDGTIVLGGYSLDRRLTSRMALTALGADGRPQAGFGERGALVLPAREAQVQGLAVDGEGRLLAAGFAWVKSAGSEQPALARVLAG